MAGEAEQEMPEHNGARYGRDDGPVPLWSPDAPLPVFAHLEGRKVALVDAGEYRALAALRDAVLHFTGSASPTNLVERLKARPTDRPYSRRAVRLSRVAKDTELAAFITERIGTEDIERVRQAAIENFGVHRVPSKSAVSRFVVAHRHGANFG